MEEGEGEGEGGSQPFGERLLTAAVNKRFRKFIFQAS